MESPALLSSNPITVPKAGDTAAAVFMSVVVSMTHLRATPRQPVSGATPEAVFTWGKQCMKCISKTAEKIPRLAKNDTKYFVTEHKRTYESAEGRLC